MSEFHDVYPDYEGLAHHDETTGKKIRKKLWRVFWILLGITIFEVIIGLYAADLGLSKTVLKVTFIALTLIKAAYIVMVFMHLKDENKWTKWVILIPYGVFIGYLLVMMTIGEGNYVRTHRLNGPGQAPQSEEAIESVEQHH
jgi:cytochrome c oxidase subunit IV